MASAAAAGTAAATLPPAPAALVARLRMAPHPEGGWFVRWYESPRRWVAPSLPDPAADADAAAAAAATTSDVLPPASPYPAATERLAATSIHYILTGGRCSLHRLRADELWYWHAGDPMVVVELTPAGPRHTVLGGDLADAGQVQTLAVRGGTYFGSYLPAGSAWTYVSCAVVPGFDFADWEMAGADALVAAFPHAAPLIRALAHDTPPPLPGALPLPRHSAPHST